MSTLHLVPKPPTAPYTAKCDRIPLRVGYRWLRSCDCHLFEPIPHAPKQRSAGDAS